MNHSAVEFWQNHSSRFLEMAFKADKRESLDNPDGYGRRSRECGDELEVFLTLRDNKIASASFETQGCLYVVACANSVVHMVEGRTIQEAWQIAPQDVMMDLETLPRAEYHCAELAVQTLHVALANVQENRRHPWRKLYHNL
jgi:nitrogen fixation NifU-like protein